MSKKEAFVAARAAIQELNDARLAGHIRLLGEMDDELKNEALDMVALWEQDGLCWSRYIHGWRDILNSDNPVEALRRTGGNINAFLQNSPLSSRMDREPLEKYWGSLKG